MNILVTGGSGFIGSHLVDKLIEAGHKVRVLDVKQPYQTNVEFLKGDITSREDVKRSLGDTDIVYHIAAFSNIDLVKAHPLTTVEYNILGTAYLVPYRNKRSGKLEAQLIVGYRGLIELAEGSTGVARGDLVDFLPFAEMMG